MPHKAFIVTDMQIDFINGVLGTPEAEAIVSNVVDKVQRAVDDPDCIVIFTVDDHDENYLASQEGRRLPVPHCIRGTAGQLLHPLLRNFIIYPNVRLLRKSTFGHSDWYGYLRQFGEIKSIEFVGVCTDICVISNVLVMKSVYPEVPIAVDASCCAGSTPERHKAALDVMRSCQIDVIGDETNA